MAVFSLLQYYREQRTTLPPLKAPDDVHSKTFLVTGSNVGLGFNASVQLAEMGPKLLIATSRDMAKCERTREGGHCSIWPIFLWWWLGIRTNN